MLIDRAIVSLPAQTRAPEQYDWPVPDKPGSARTGRNVIVTAFWLQLSDENLLSLNAYTAAA